MIDGRRPGTRTIESVHLREYAKHDTVHERVTAFLQDVDGASRAEISGATGDSWASVHGVLASLLSDGLIDAVSTEHPEVYRWRA